MAVLTLGAACGPPAPPAPPPPAESERSIQLVRLEGDKEECTRAIFREEGRVVHVFEAPWATLEIRDQKDGTVVLYVDEGGNGWHCRYLELFRWGGEGVRRITPPWKWGHLTEVTEDGSWRASDIRFEWIPRCCHGEGLSVSRAFRPDGTEETAGYRARLEALAAEGGLKAGLEFWLLSEILGEGPAGHAFFRRQEASWDQELNAIEMLEHHEAGCGVCAQVDSPLPPANAGARPIGSRLEWMRWARHCREEIDTPVRRFGSPSGWVGDDGRIVWLNGDKGARVLGFDEAGTLIDQGRIPGTVTCVEPMDITADGRTDWLVETMGSGMRRRLMIMKGTDGMPRLLKGSVEADPHSSRVVRGLTLTVSGIISYDGYDPLMEPVAKRRQHVARMRYDPRQDRMIVIEDP